MAAAAVDLANVYESDRQNLMKHLLDAVKQCQVRFGGKTELATEKDSCVQCLLAQFENAFLHGLKKGRVWGAINSLSEPLRHVTGIKVLSAIPDAEITFWPFLKENMPPSEIQRYLSINSIHAESGRCRSWLRSCFNETSLERNLVALLSNKGLLRQFYEDWALFLDEERSSTLPVMARGLGSILFAIDIENSKLNAPFKEPSFPRANQALAPVEATSKSDPLVVPADKGSNAGDHTIVNKKKRKKKVKQATIEEIEVPEDEPPYGINRQNVSSAGQALIEGKTNSNTMFTQKKEKHADIGKAASSIGYSKEESVIKSHRRATSLESSEIIRHKQKSNALNQMPSNDFEVPNFGLRKKPSAESEKAIRSENRKKDKIDEKGATPLGSLQDDESPVNSEYTSILSKLADLSTSFKSSFTTGFLQKTTSKEYDHNAAAISEESKVCQDDFKSLLEDEDYAFKSNAKLEMQEEPNDTSPVKFECDQVSATEESSKLSGNVNSKSLAGTIPSGGSAEDARKRLGSSEYFNKVLQKGNPLSSQDCSSASSPVMLSTPPPTPADSFMIKVKNDEISSVGLEERLHELEQKRTEIEANENEVNEEDIETSELYSLKHDSRKFNEDSSDRMSVNSSNAESVYDDLDTIQPVGFESAKFSGMVMSYDRQSSQAANDMMQLLRTSTEVGFAHDGHERKTEEVGNTTRPYHEERLAWSDTSKDRNDLSTAELKQAILATVKRKDEIEERNRVLQLALDEERESSMSLRSDVDGLNDKLRQIEETSSRQIAELARENEVLRNQLKKYVAAVQLLKRENLSVSKETNAAVSTLRGYSQDTEVVLPAQPKERTDSEMDSIYEEKLIQMSELHGELMEFHENLQRDLFKKQKIIAKMRDELIALRGPLPEGVDDTCQDDEREAQQIRPLINVWIPSVFIKGKGSDAHHLYQIYIRIGDEEWNIYRRYSQFHKMHITSSKQYQEIEKLNFPPKKIIGKKDIKFVEGRRKKLQEYIRRLINVSIAKDPLLAQSPSKENLEKSLSFFSDEFSFDAKKKKESSKKKQPSPAVYTGL